MYKVEKCINSTAMNKEEDILKVISKPNEYTKRKKLLTQTQEFSELQ